MLCDGPLYRTCILAKQMLKPHAIHHVLFSCQYPKQNEHALCFITAHSAVPLSRQANTLHNPFHFSLSFPASFSLSRSLLSILTMVSPMYCSPLTFLSPLTLSPQCTKYGTITAPSLFFPPFLLSRSLLSVLSMALLQPPHFSSHPFSSHALSSVY